MSIGQFVSVNKTERVLELYVKRDFGGLEDYTRKLLKSLGATALPSEFVVSSTPSLDWTPNIKDLGDYVLDPAEILESLIIGYDFKDRAALETFRKQVLKAKPPVAGEDGFLSVGANPGAGSAEHWCPGGTVGAVFGRQRDARSQIRAQALGDADLRGQAVNVLIVDQGLSSEHLPPANYGGGLDYDGNPAGGAERTSHGMMVAREILDLAPDARLFDVPIIPSRIRPVLTAVDRIYAVFELLRLVVAILRNIPGFKGPWLVVNAWAVFDRSDEEPLGDYTQDGHPTGHPLNDVIDRMAQTTDVVFAAGNSGQYCPDPRSGPTDRGPGHSIWGGNAHKRTITAGAVRADDLWIGSASQGPVLELDPDPVLLDPAKPDFAAPSFFRDDLDAATHYTGTSAACAVSAGVVAALRSKPAWNQADVPPEMMRDALTTSARKTLGAGWNNRTGHGILDVEAAMNTLP
jgi:hypothetical protein